MHTAHTIASAIPMLEEFLAILEQAYWEASSMSSKDYLYDSISTINNELSELAKLSIQDHDLLYEPISPEFKVTLSRLPRFRESMNDFIGRGTTVITLDMAIAAILELTKENTAM